MVGQFDPCIGATRPCQTAVQKSNNLLPVRPAGVPRWVGGSGQKERKPRARSRSESSQHPLHATRQPLCYIDPNTHLLSSAEEVEEWQVVCGKFLAINSTNMSCACPRSPGGLSPFAHLGDGSSDLILIRKCSRFNFLRFLIRHTNQEDQVRRTLAPRSFTLGQSPPHQFVGSVVNSKEEKSLDVSISYSLNSLENPACKVSYESGCQRDGSAGKSIGCLYRGTTFNSQHPHNGSQLSTTPVPGDPGHHGHQARIWCTDTHAGKPQPPTHTHLKIINS